MQDFVRIERLYREYRLPLWRYACRLLHDKHLACDVVQSVFTKLLEKGELIYTVDEAHTRAYLMRMVRNLCYTIHRQQKRHPVVSLELALYQIDEKQNLEDGLLHQCEREELWTALCSLSREYRDVVIMKYILGMKDEEIGSALGMKPSSVRVAVYRGVKALRGKR